MGLNSLGGYVARHVEHGEPLIFDDEWATREAVLAELHALRDGCRKEVADCQRHATDSSRGEDNRAYFAGRMAEQEATAAKYDAAIAALTGDAA